MVAGPPILSDINSTEDWLNITSVLDALHADPGPFRERLAAPPDEALADQCRTLSTPELRLRVGELAALLNTRPPDRFAELLTAYAVYAQVRGSIGEQELLLRQAQPEPLHVGLVAKQWVTLALLKERLHQADCDVARLDRHQADRAAWHVNF